MGARDVLDRLTGAGVTVTVEGDSLIVRPASLLTDQMRDALRASKTDLLALLRFVPSTPVSTPPCACDGCSHLGPRKTCFRPIEAGLIPAAEGFGLAWPEPGHAATCRAFAQKVVQVAQDRPYRLSKAEADAVHADAWDEAAIGRFQARVGHIGRLGFSEQDADDLAEHLHLRDVHTDHRINCLECAHLTGTVRRLQCRNHQTAGVGRDLPVDLAVLPQVCAGFKDQT